MSEAFKELPNGGRHYCFACSPINPAGLHMKFFSDGRTVVSSVTIPDHLCGWDNIAHGGVISTILDEVMSWSAIYLLKSYILTQSMRVDFLKPVFVGDRVRASGRAERKISSRQAVMTASLYREGAEAELCARAEGTFALVNARMIRKLGIVNEETLNSFARLIADSPSAAAP